MSSCIDLDSNQPYASLLHLRVHDEQLGIRCDVLDVDIINDDLQIASAQCMFTRVRSRSAASVD